MLAVPPGEGLRDHQAVWQVRPFPFLSLDPAHGPISPFSGVARERNRTRPKQRLSRSRLCGLGKPPRLSEPQLPWCRAMARDLPGQLLCCGGLGQHAGRRTPSRAGGSGRRNGVGCGGVRYRASQQSHRRCCGGRGCWHLCLSLVAVRTSASELRPTCLSPQFCFYYIKKLSLW